MPVETSELWEASGGDPDKCELCGEPLDDTRPWQRGLDGAGAHCDCLDSINHDGDDEEEERDG